MNVLTGGTDVHLVLADLRDSELDGQQAEDRLHEIGITVNRNAVPVRPAAAGRLVGPADRHAGAGHARLPGRRLPRGGQDHREALTGRVGRLRKAGAGRAHARPRRALPAVPAPGRRGRLS